MGWRARALILGYPLVELITAYAIAQWIGWGWTLLLLVIGLPVGFGILRNAGSAALADAQRSASTGEPVDQGRHALTMLGGILIAVPGFWTDLIGLLLVVPPTQRLFRARAGAWATARMGNMRMPGVSDPRGFSGDVVKGTVISVEDIRDDPDRPPPALP